MVNITKDANARKLIAHFVPTFVYIYIYIYIHASRCVSRECDLSAVPSITVAY